ncbi:MAG: sugar phosphate isomerase/epimerase family protein [Acidobacteriota bacterium]|nr:sugar phosphate isomerase/epimerase family protein [Acidobacteriota bacterium]
MQRHLDRRRFLTLATASAAAAMAPVSTGAAPRDGMMKALKIGMIRVDGSVEDKFRAAAAAGFDGVELDSPNELDTAEVLAARDATGLEIPGVVDSVHWRQHLSDPSPEVRAAGLAGLETALRDCKAYGGSTVLLVPAVVSKRVSYADAYRRSQAEIRKALPLAAELGIQIAIENVWNGFLLSPVEAARYVDEIESPQLGWYFDVGNIVNFGWPEHWIDTLGKRILKLDIKEYSREKRDAEGPRAGFDVKLLEGDCDWPSVMSALDRIGYRGWGSAEVPGGGPDRLRDISSRMDRIYAL